MYLRYGGLLGGNPLWQQADRETPQLSIQTLDNLNQVLPNIFRLLKLFPSVRLSQVGDELSRPWEVSESSRPLQIPAIFLQMLRIRVCFGVNPGGGGENSSKSRG